MRDSEITTPLVAQAKVAQSKTMNVLLHLHVPEIHGKKKLESIFSNTLAMRVIVTSSDVAIDPHREDLARFAFEFLPRQSVPSDSDDRPSESSPHGGLAPVFAGKSLRQIEKIVIEQVIASARGSVPKAAKKLGVSPSTLYRKREAWAAK